MSARRWGACACVIAGLVVGCGGDDDDGGGGDTEQLRQVVAQLQVAAREDDGDRICNDLFTENLRISVQRASKQPCGDEVAENVTDDTSYTLSDIQVTGTNATAVLEDQDGTKSNILFQQEGGGWRIARVEAVDAQPE